MTPLPYPFLLPPTPVFAHSAATTYVPCALTGFFSCSSTDFRSVLPTTVGFQYLFYTLPMDVFLLRLTYTTTGFYAVLPHLYYLQFTLDHVLVYRFPNRTRRFVPHSRTPHACRTTWTTVHAYCAFFAAIFSPTSGFTRPAPPHYYHLGLIRHLTCNVWTGCSLSSARVRIA